LSPTDREAVLSAVRSTFPTIRGLTRR
jgi:hypothetical protein